MQGGRVVGDHSEAFVAFDTSKLRNAVAVAEAGRSGEVRFLGEIDTTPSATGKLVRKLAEKYERLAFCYEAGPTGYGLYRQITSLGHACIVVAPSLIPKKAGDRVKTDRRDALDLASQLRAGQLTAVWVPDPRHEAMRDLTRARGAAVEDLRMKRQQVSAFLLRLGVPYAGKTAWTKARSQLHSVSLRPDAMAGVTPSRLLCCFTKFYQTVYSATIFLEEALVKRLKRRMCIRIVRLCRSTYDVLT
jgi:transposase